MDLNDEEVKIKNGPPFGLIVSKKIGAKLEQL